MINKLKILGTFFRSAVLYGTVLLSFTQCGSRTEAENNSSSEAKKAEFWLTTADQKTLLQQQNPISFRSSGNVGSSLIEVYPAETYQTVDGFGYTLTGGSVEVINRLPEAQKNGLLQELFGNSTTSIGISYLRISMGASDLDREVFSYNDLAAGETDPELVHFTLKKDEALIEMLNKILQINPQIKIIATPWSPPVWMKDNGSSIGGSLKPEFYSVYAQYFVKYIQGMAQNGINIDAITPQNEPLHPGNNPSMLMLAEQQAAFIKNNLGPAFQQNKIQTKIVLYDHNCNKPEYPISILNDPETRKFVDGSAFHLYEGDISALSTVHNAHPDKNLYFTEQWTGAQSDFQGDLMWHVKNVIIGSMKNWSKTALEWNLANDENYHPHTPSGCTECKGALTIAQNGTVNRNVGYFIIAHASKFVPAGSKHIKSTSENGVENVAFVRPDGKITIIMMNDQPNEHNFAIRYNGKVGSATIPGYSVGTFILPKQNLK